MVIQLGEDELWWSNL